DAVAGGRRWEGIPRFGAVNAEMGGPLRHRQRLPRPRVATERPTPLRTHATTVSDASSLTAGSLSVCGPTADPVVPSPVACSATGWRTRQPSALAGAATVGVPTRRPSAR